MTYTDHYTYEAAHILDPDFQKITSAADTDKPALLLEFCRKAIAAKAAKTMSLRDAAYAIAGTMFIHELRSPPFEEITGLAGELELPSEHVTGDPEVRWVKLVKLIDEYAKSLKSER